MEAAWRLTVESWLVCHGLITVLPNKNPKVSTNFPKNWSHTDQSLGLTAIGDPVGSGFKMKQEGRSLKHSTLAELRRMAVRRVMEDGVQPGAIAAEYGFCRNYLYRWLQKFRGQGWEALAERIAQGPAPKLDEKQRQQVKRWIIGQDPRQCGFDFGLWSGRIVQALIEQRLGVEMGLTAVGRLLASLEITPQKPLRRA
jgi:transposase